MTAEIDFNSTTENKKSRYEEFTRKLEALIHNEHDEVSVMANVSSALKETFGFFWVGFYIVKDNILSLGPFQGSVACYRIKKGNGVCGTAWERKETIVVPDVERFPRHIACSQLSKSEIVVPLLRQGDVAAVLDIDSDRLDSFDDTDKSCLEHICRLVSANIYSGQ